MKLTPRQQEILDFIRSTLEVLGAPPTRMEISHAFGFASANAAEDHLKALADSCCGNVQGRYALDAQLFNPRADYLLKVRGLSMIDAGIFEGDLLAVHKTSEARDGQIVIARVAEDVTVKRLKRRNGLIELIAENPDFEPIIVNPAEVEFAIEGIAVGLIRGAISTLS